MVASALILLAVPGCTANRAPFQAPVESVSIDIPFEESFPDVEGAKRVAVCQFNDDRSRSAFIIGESSSGGVSRKLVVREDLTLVMPRVLGASLKQIGFNVSFAERAPDVRGEFLRDILKQYNADYLIVGRLQEFSCQVQPGPGRPTFASVACRLDVYDGQGRLRIAYPAGVSRPGLLGEKAESPVELSAFVNATVQDLLTRAFEEAYFVKALDMDVETVKKLMEARPASSEPTPEETKSEETAPGGASSEPAAGTEEPKKEMSEEERLDQQRRDAARRMDDAVREMQEREAGRSPQK
jgi:hypothetical protein